MPRRPALKAALLDDVRQLMGISVPDVLGLFRKLDALALDHALVCFDRAKVAFEELLHLAEQTQVPQVEQLAVQARWALYAVEPELGAVGKAAELLRIATDLTTFAAAHTTLRTHVPRIEEAAVTCEGHLKAARDLLHRSLP